MLLAKLSTFKAICFPPSIKRICSKRSNEALLVFIGGSGEEDWEKDTRGTVLYLH